MKNNKIRTIALVVLAAGVVIGIAVYGMQPNSLLNLILSTPTLSAGELESFLGNSSCFLPCWQGITPGITTSTEALQRLHESHLILKNTIQSEESKPGFGKAQWHWQFDGRQLEGYGDMEWSDGIVRSVGLGTYPMILLGEIINKFGPPQKIDVLDCTEIVEGPQHWCVTLLYAKVGFEVQDHLERSGSGKGVQITPADPISFIVLFQPSTIEEWLSSLGFDPQVVHLQDWKGYGDLIELYVP